MRFNTDTYRSLNESITEVQNPQTALNEARDYAALLESVVVDLCEEFGLDPDAVMEMAMTLPRLHQTNRELGGLYDRETRGDKKAGSEFKKKLKQQKTEISSKKRYGVGGKVLKGKSRSSDYKKYGD